MSRETNPFGSVLAADESELEQAFGSFGELKAERKTPKEREELLSRLHMGLTRLYWIRMPLEQALVDKNVTLTPDYKNGEVVIKIDPPLVMREIVPYSPQGKVSHAALFSLDNTKMRCPTFSIPAGAPETGGSCPGATAGQTTADSQAQAAKKVLPILQANGCDKDEIDLTTSICDHCYATTGQFQYTNKQFMQVVIFYWLKFAKHSDVKLVMQAALDAAKKQGWQKEKIGGKSFYFFRLHDSGDFFADWYIKMWIEIARDNPDIKFWAPTRIWVTGLSKVVENEKDFPDNLVIRPSAYHFQDASPESIPNMAAGSTSLYAVETDEKGPVLKKDGSTAKDKKGNVRLRMLKESAYDPNKARWNCRTYAVGAGEAHTCLVAENPMGGKGCRACWMMPDLTINYSAH
jgi:hypothetical protein